LVAVLLAALLAVSPAQAVTGAADPADALVACGAGSLNASHPGPVSGQHGTPGALAARRYARVFVPNGASVVVSWNGGRRGSTQYSVQLAELSTPTAAFRNHNYALGNVTSDDPNTYYPITPSSDAFTWTNTGTSRDVLMVSAPNQGPNLKRLDVRITATVTSGGNPVSCAQLDQARIDALLGGQPTGGDAVDPVDTGSGDFYDTTVDLASPGGSYGMAFSRTYNSLDDGSYADPTTFQTGVLGPGWSTPLDVSLRNKPTGGLIFRGPDGRRLFFPVDPGGGWVLPTELFASLAEIPNSNPSLARRVLTFSGGEVWTFDGHGRLLEMDDGWGRSVEVTRNATTGVPTALTSTTAGGTPYALTFTDTGTDRLIDRATGPDGAFVDYGYTAGVLTSVSAPHYSGDPAGGETFDHNGVGQITAIHQEVDPAESDVVRVANTYDDYGRVETQTYPSGDVATFTYCGLGASTCGPSTSTTRTTKVVHSAPGVDDQTVHFLHDADGRLVRIDDPLGVSATWGWDRDLPSAFEDRAGAASEAGFDTAGRLAELLPPDPTTGAVASTGQTVTYCDASADDPRIRSTTDLAGIVTEYAYGPSSDPDYPCAEGALVPSSTTFAAGTTEEAVTTVQSSDSLVTEVEDADGVVTTFAWDTAKGLLLSSTVDADVSASGVQTTYYGYDAAGRPTVTRTPLGIETWTRYDGAGRVVEQIGPVAVTRTCGSTSCSFGSTPPSGPTVTTTYWSDGSLRSSTDEAAETTDYEVEYLSGGGWREIETQPDGDVRVALYDEAGDMVEQQSGDPANTPSDPLVTTTFDYDLLGRVTQETSPEGVETHFDYDTNGNVTAEVLGTDPEDPERTSTTVYDFRGRVVDEYGPTGDVDETSSAVRSHTHYDYDDADRLVEEVEGDGADAQRIWYRYDAAGRLRFTITDLDGDDAAHNPASGTPGDRDPDDLVVETTYTAAGRQETEVTPPVDATSFDWGDSGTSSQKRTTTYLYDDAGRVIEVEHPAGPSSTFTYDADGRPATATSPDGFVEERGYDAAGRVTSVTTPSPAGTGSSVATTGYTARGEVEWETEPHDPSETAYPATRYGYHADGALAWVRDPRADEFPTYASYVQVDYGYDGRGNRTSRSTWTKDSVIASPSAITEEWEYNLDSQVIRHQQPSGADVDYGYSAETGWLDTITQESGRIEQRAHWASGLVAESTSTQPGEDPVTVEQWFDDHGRRTRMTDPTGNTDYAYDRGGRVTTFSQPGTHEAEYEYQYGYGLTGEPVSQTYADGSEFSFEHDPLGRLLSSNVYVDVLSSFWPVAEYSYDDDGDLVETIVNGVYGNREWAFPSNGAHNPETYTQDLNPDTDANGTPNTTGAGQGGDLTTSMEWGPDGRIAEETTDGDTWEYTYDSAGQLIGRDGDGVEYGYAYGLRGNRIISSENAVATSYQYDEDLRLLASDGAVDATFAYDADGRRVEADTNLGGGDHRVVTSTYDPRGRLVGTSRAEDSQTFDVERTVDGDGRVTGIDLDGGVDIDVAWDPTRPVPQVLDSYLAEGVWSRMAYGLERVVYSFTNEGSSVSSHGLYPYDAHGSTIADGFNVQAPEGYDPYGQPSDAGGGPSYFGYRAELTVDGLVHLRNREYDPTTGTFTTPDPLDSVDGTSTVANPYHYTSNDPLNRMDPLGLRTDNICHSTAFWGLNQIEEFGCRYRPELIEILSVTGSAAVGTLCGGLAVPANVAHAAASAAAFQVCYGGTRRLLSGDPLFDWGQIATDAVFGAAAGATGYGAGYLIAALIRPSSIVGRFASSVERRFPSYSAFRTEFGPAGRLADGTRLEWHHIVEQRAENAARVGVERVQNTRNIIYLDHATHTRVSAEYSRIRPSTNGLRLRDWISANNLSFDDQFELGLDILRDLGVRVR
jgi:RHS repeat-associated protein